MNNLQSLKEAAQKEMKKEIDELHENVPMANIPEEFQANFIVRAELIAIKAYKAGAQSAREEAYREISDGLPELLRIEGGEAGHSYANGFWACKDQVKQLLNSLTKQEQ